MELNTKYDKEVSTKAVYPTLPTLLTIEKESIIPLERPFRVSHNLCQAQR